MTEMSVEEPENQTTPRRRRSLLVWFLLFVFLFVGLTAVIGGGFGFLAYSHIIAENPGTGQRVEITVTPGEVASDIGVTLAEVKLVEHALLFRIAAKLDNQGGTIQAGHYELERGLSPMQLLHALYEGPVRPYLGEGKSGEFVKVTIPEGLTLEQIAELFDDPQAFLDAAASPAILSHLPEGVTHAEGFLMPNTYFFDGQPMPAQIARRMAEEFAETYAALLVEIPDATTIDPLRVVTVASLVEEESRAEEERPIVASVIYNRLEKGMALGMDSTLQYVLKKYGQRMLYEDKEVDSPYNTYKNVGLPPGPISNPGVACLRAALAPMDTDYLYFVSNADGKTHTFSRTLREHEAAVQKYRRDIAEQRRALKQ